MAVTCHDVTQEPPDEPLLLLEHMLAEETARLASGRERLADIGDALMRLRARMHHLDLGQDTGVQVLSQEVAAPIIDRLADDVDRVDNAVLRVDVGAGSQDANTQHERDRAGHGQRQRTLLHPAVLDTELGRSRLAMAREASQEQRVSDTIGTEFVVLGDEAVVTVDRWGDPSAPYLFLTNPVLVRAFASWFETVWQVSPQLRTGAVGDEALLRLLALGVKDETIARTSGVSLRTVRRRVAALMDQYGVSTRFQLGAALERAGRLGERRR